MELLKKLRLKNNLKQDKIAKCLGVSCQCYSHYENGRRQPTPEMLVKIADYFNVSTDYILGRESEDGIIAINDTSNYSENEELLIIKYRKLNQQQRYMTFGYIDGLLSI